MENTEKNGTGSSTPSENDYSEIKKRKAELPQSRNVSAFDYGPGFCPNCGAYVGGYATCPWCKAKMPHAFRLRLTQYLTVAFVIVGLVGVGFYAGINPAPYVYIDQIGPTYANGTVSIRGTITDIDYWEASDGSWKVLQFMVNDSTGAIPVKAYTETVDQLIAAHNTPAIGFNCSVRGSVFVRGDDLYLLLESPSHLKIEKANAVNISAADLYNSFTANKTEVIGKLFRVNGTVTKIADDSVYLDLDDKVRVYFPEYVRTFSPDATLTVIEGDFIEVVGILTDFYGIPEILPASVYDIRIISHGGVLG